MQFTPSLPTGRFVRRYKRFLAEVQLEKGVIRTIHCPNTGSMLGCSQPGSLAAFSTSEIRTRKYPDTLEMIFQDEVWIGVNTSRTNALVEEALQQNIVSGLRYPLRIQREVRTSLHCRLDLMVEGENGPVYIEAKNCSLVQQGCAYFPDAVTQRGAKHLTELIRLVKAGHRGIIFFLVQRNDAKQFSPADHIDPRYGTLLREAIYHGVEIVACRARVSPEAIEIVDQLPCIF